MLTHSLVKSQLIGLRRTILDAGVRASALQVWKDLRGDDLEKKGFDLDTAAK